MGTAASASHCELRITSLVSPPRADLASQLSSTVPLDSRPEYHRVWLRPTSTGLKAFSTGGQRSSRTVSLAGSNGLLELPPSSGGDKERKEGEVVNCVVIGEIGSLVA